MSKLADRIRKATKLQSGHIGFGSARTAVEPTMVLAALASDGKSGADLRERGADVVIVGASGKAAPKDGAGSLEGIIGARIAGREDDEAKAYREAGYDFVVFDPGSASASALLDEDVGYVIALPSDFGDSELRTLESFGLDAIDIGAISGHLSARRLIDLRRIYALTRKPLMAKVDGNMSGASLQALREANVVVVIADRPDDIERLRRTIDALPPRARPKGDDRPTPLVPRSQAAGEEHDEDDDD